MANVPKGARRKVITCLVILLLLSMWPYPVLADGPIRWEQLPGPSGGIVKFLAVDPNNPRVLFAATSSGIYKSVDSGATWRRLSGSVECEEINVLAINPLNSNLVYAGSNQGLFRSMDGGISWAQTGIGLTSDFVLSLAISPLQPDTLYVGCDTGIFKSSDKGDHWSPVGPGLPSSNIWALAVHPSDPRRIYAGTDEGIYSTSDGGQTWRLTSRGLPPDEHVLTIVIDPQTPQTLYAGTSGGIFRSSDGGNSWSAIAPQGDKELVSVIVQDPQEPRIIYAVFGYRNVRKSTDGGNTWRPLYPSNGGGPILAMAVHPQTPQRLYLGTGYGILQSPDGGETWAPSHSGIVASDVRQIADVPGNAGHLYAATQWGIFRTTDAGKTWQETSRGLKDLNILKLAIDPWNPRRIYASTFEGAIYHTTDGGENWTFVREPIAKGAQVIDMVVCYPSSYRGPAGALFVSVEGSGIFRSVDMGRTWQSLTEGLPADQVGALASVREEGRFLYAGIGRNLYRLPLGNDPTQAVVWERVTPRLLNGYVTSILIEPNRGKHIYYVTTDAGGIYRGQVGENQMDDLARNTLLSKIQLGALSLISRRDQSPLLCVLTDGGLFCTSDGGRTWSHTGGNCLQQQAIHSVATDDRTPGVVYLGTSKSGVYRGHVEAALLISILKYSSLSALTIALVFVAGLVVWYFRRLNALHQTRLFDQQWPTWERDISHALLIHNRVMPETLTTIPTEMRERAMQRYLVTHKEQDLILRQEPSSIEPKNYDSLQRFSGNWHALRERLTNIAAARPVATQITEQLCELLSFSPIETRVFKSLFGYVVRVPNLRLSVPARFPIIFVLKRGLSEDDIRDIRGLMSVLNMTSFFALLVVVDDQIDSRERAKVLKRLVQDGADDFIVLDYQDLHSLFLATDAERRLVELILAQADLTVISPYITSGPVPEHMFFGRDYELKAIMRTLRDHSFAIVGGRKIGKTSVLAKVHRLMAQSGDLKSFYLDCQHVSNYTEFFNALAVACQVSVGPAVPDELRHIILRLRRRSEGQTIVLLLDEVDGLLAFDLRNQTRLFRMLRALSQEGLCHFVFCGQRELHRAIHDSKSPLFNFASVIRLSYLPIADVRRIVMEPMATIGIRFEDAEATVKGVADLSSGHPNIVQEICQMLIKRINDRHDRTITVSDLEHIRADDEFRDLFFEVVWGDATALERLITLLEMNASDFQPSEIRQALAERGCDVSLSEIESALDDLVLFSIFQKQGNRYSFSVRSFPQIMAESNLAGAFIEGLIEDVKDALVRSVA